MSESEFLSPSQILEQPTLVIEELDVPEWKGKVRVKMLSAKERDEFEASTVEYKNGKSKPNIANLRARLVQLAVVNADGRRMFTKHDVNVLGDLPAAGLQRVFNKVQEMSAITEEDLDDLAEDFDKTDDEPSSSD
jgi:hypothetical protein